MQVKNDYLQEPCHRMLKQFYLENFATYFQINTTTFAQILDILLLENPKCHKQYIIMFKIVPKFSDNGFYDDDDAEEEEEDEDNDDEEANLKGQKYMTQETTAQNIKNQHQTSIENKTEELERKPMHGQFY